MSESKSWYNDLKFTRTHSENEAFRVIQEDWYCQSTMMNHDKNNLILYGKEDVSKNDIIYNVPGMNYVILFSQRYPKHSRDYQDEGFYIELIGASDFEPLCVCVCMIGPIVPVMIGMMG